MPIVLDWNIDFSSSINAHMLGITRFTRILYTPLYSLHNHKYQLILNLISCLFSVETYNQSCMFDVVREHLDSKSHDGAELKNWTCRVPFGALHVLQFITVIWWYAPFGDDAMRWLGASVH